MIARELTKVYEEIIRGAISEVVKKLSGKKMKGEFTILISSANYSEKVLLSKKE